MEVCQSVSSPSGFLLTSFDSDYIAPFPLFTFGGVKQNDIEHSQIQDPFFVHPWIPTMILSVLSSGSFISSTFQDFPSKTCHFPSS